MDLTPDRASRDEERRKLIAERVARAEMLRRRFAVLRKSVLHPLVLLTMVVAWWPFRFAPPWPVVNGAQFTSAGLRFDAAGMVTLDAAPEPAPGDEDPDLAHFELDFAPEDGVDGSACLLSVGTTDSPADRLRLLRIDDRVLPLGFQARWSPDDHEHSGHPMAFDVRSRWSGRRTWRITLGNDVDGRHPWSGLVTLAVVTIGTRRFDLLDPKQVTRPSWYWSLPAGLSPGSRIITDSVSALRETGSDSVVDPRMLAAMLLGGWMTLVLSTVGLAFHTPRAVPLIGFALAFGVILQFGQLVFDGRPSVFALAALESGALLGCGIALQISARRKTVR